MRDQGPHPSAQERLNAPERRPNPTARPCGWLCRLRSDDAATVHRSGVWPHRTSGSAARCEDLPDPRSPVGSPEPGEVGNDLLAEAVRVADENVMAVRHWFADNIASA